MKKVILLTSAFFLGACATQEQNLADAIKKNPKIVFDVIEENPEQFIDVINRAARKAQESQYNQRMSEMKRQQQNQLENPLKPAISKDTLVSGSETAPIVIVEYADFQCPACKVAHDPLKKVLEKYKDRVQFHYKHMPLDMHPMALPAARYYEALRAEDKNKAAEFYNIMFKEQSQMRSEDFFKKSVKKVGANPQSISKNINSPEIEKKIQMDITEFEKFGFTGTPVIIVNGVALHGAQPAEEIEKVIELTKTK